MSTGKPPFSAWLTAQRKARGWKQEEAARRLREAGYEASDTTYRTWEASRRPRAATVAALEQMFGSIAPTEDQAIAGIPELVAAIGELVEEMRLARQAEPAWATALAGLLLRPSSAVDSELQRSDVLRRGQ